MLGLHRARVTHMQPLPQLTPRRTETLVQPARRVQSKLSIETNVEILVERRHVYTGAERAHGLRLM